MDDDPRHGPVLHVRAPAKINLYFEVLGERPDGYHEVWTVMQAVSLFDELTFRATDDGLVQLSCSDASLPTDERNLVVKAGRLLQQRYGVKAGASIDLRKAIPVGGGLGGGSADCGLALLALRRLWGLDLSLGDLQAFAADLGSDVAFFLRGGTALCTGRGECVAPLPCPQPMHYVLILPGVHVSTAAVYGMARSALTTRGRGRNNVQRALRRGDVWLLGKSLRNDLQLHALQLHPELGEVWSALERVNEFPDVGGALLSGSGSTFFAVVRDRDAAEEAARILRAALKVRCVAVQSVLAWDDANWGWQ